MKLPILISLFIGASMSIDAQIPRITAGNPRTETYPYYIGGDSIRLVILGQNDTLKVTGLYKNGHVKYLKWRNDSLYEFDELGRLISKNFYFTAKDNRQDSTIRFHSNGQRAGLDFHSLTCDIKAAYNTEGVVTFSETATRDSIIGNQISTEKNGILRKIAWKRKLKDKTFIESDTLFYPSGKCAVIRMRRDYEDVLRHEWFNEDGTSNRQQCPDSLALTSFKDNLNCFYGLQNKRGDTIFKPIFDRIYIEKNYHIVTYMGENATLYTMDGKPIPPFAKNLKNVYEIYNEDSFPDFTKFGQGSYYAEKDDEDKIRTKKFFVFQDGTQFGVVDENYKIVIPPQRYMLTGEHFENKYFTFSEKLKNEKSRNGYVNTLGKSIFPDSCPNVNHFCENYFTVEFPHLIADSSFNNKSLANAEGTIILPQKFYHFKYFVGSNLCMATVLDIKNSRKNAYAYLSPIKFDIDGKEVGKPHVFFLAKKGKKWGVVSHEEEVLKPFDFDYVTKSTYPNQTFIQT
jgi:hypothetical protein